MASNLRRISIGFKLDRYIPEIQSAIDKQNACSKSFWINAKRTTRPETLGLPTLRSILSIIQPLVSLAPTDDDSAETVLKKAKQFLLTSARCENKLDRHARKILLDEIDGRIATLEFADESVAGLLAWLEELPVESRIFGSGPQPGCIHASPIRSGGYTGRKQTFVIGMDANRFPRSARVDPLLLDHERTAISADLETSAQIADRSQRELTDALSRIAETENTSVHFSFSTRSLVEDRDQSPSPSLVELYRITSESPNAHMDDLLAHVGSPVSFASANPDDWLTPHDGELAEVLTTADESSVSIAFRISAYALPKRACCPRTDANRQSSTRTMDLCPKRGRFFRRPVRCSECHQVAWKRSEPARGDSFSNTDWASIHPMNGTSIQNAG